MATKIEWTERTWNPVTGCTKVSEACQNCYAEVMSRRLKGMGQKKYANGFKVTLHPECLNEPYSWKKPCMVFVVSMGDLFHKDVPFEYIDEIFKVIKDTPQHTYQILTKRADRLFDYYFSHINICDKPKNVWLGVTCESREHYWRVDVLRDIFGAGVRFISCEPLLGSLHDINLNGIDWVTAGGESGNRARPTNEYWVRSLRNRCVETETAFFFKQWGTWGGDGIRRSKKENGCLLDGVEWKQMPKVLL